MAANADTNKFTLSPAAAISSEELPVATVTAVSFGVTVKWDIEETTAMLSTLYSDAPYSFSATKADEKEPSIKTFGSLLGCNGGVLTISGVRYRIQVLQGQQQEQVPLAYQPALEFAKKQMEEHTEKKSFSTAGYTFARLLLSERGILVRTKPVNLENGDGPEPPSFDWTVKRMTRRTCGPVNTTRLLKLGNGLYRIFSLPIAYTA